MLTSGGERIDADGALPAVSGNNYGRLTDVEATVMPADGRVDLGMTFVGMGTIYSANLDCIDINYTRSCLRLYAPRCGSKGPRPRCAYGM